ncbi:MAG: TonB-dependent receptor, partial [Bacteroidota bacterium]
SYLGYQTRTIRLTPALSAGDLTIALNATSRQLQEVEIVSNRKEQLIKASAGVSTIGVTPAQLSTLPSFGEKDIFRSLQLLPGVSGTNESSSGLFVRGGTPDQNLVLFDGFTVYHVDHLFGFFSAFNSNAIKDVQLYKGGFEAKYGGRLSSVVDLTGKDGNTEYFNAGMGLSLLSYNGFVEAPFAEGKGSILVAGRRSFQSNFYNNLFDAFTDTNSGPAGAPQGGLGGRFGLTEVQPNSYFYDLNAKITYRLAKDNISISFYNGQDNLDNSRNIDQNSFSDGPFGNRFGGGTNNNLTFNSNNTDLTNWGNWGTSLKWSRRWSSRWYSNLHLSYSNYYSERDRSNETTINRSDTAIIRNSGSYELNDLKDYTLKFDNELSLSGNHQLAFGIQATYNDIEYDFTQNDTISVISRADQGLITTAYLQDRYTFKNQFILSGGLRLSHYELTNQLYWEPRASFTYLITDQWKAKGAWGRYYQFANRIVREDIQQGSRDFWLLADDSQIPVGFSQHFIAGLSFETPNYLFDIEGYYKQLDGLSEYSTRFIPSGFGPNQQLNYEEFFYQGDGIAQGMEFLLQKKSGALTGWLSYTLGQVKYDFPIFGEEPFFANQDQTHELKLVSSYKYKRWDFSATFIYATGRPYTAPTGFYEVPLLNGNSADFFEVSDKNALRLPDYHRLDLSATYNFKMWDGPATLGLSLFNLYNRANIWYKEYEVIEGELIETNITLLDLTPSLFFTYQLK